MQSRVFVVTAALATAIFALTPLFPVPSQIQPAPDKNWPMNGGAPGNAHYSALDQINLSNVPTLQQAWSFDTQESGGLQTSPIIVDGVLYGITPTQKVFALDAATGKLKANWRRVNIMVGMATLP